MKSLSLLLGAIVLLLLCGALPSPGGQQTAVFRSPVFLVLAGAACAGGLVCVAWNRRVRRAASLLCHAGPLVLLGGAVAGYLGGADGKLMLPLTARHRLDRVQTATGTVVPLGFAVSATDFKVDFYPPVYELCDDSMRPVRRFAVDEVQKVDAGPGVEVTVDALRGGAGDPWRDSLVLDNGWSLRLTGLAPRTYEAQLTFAAGDGQATTRVLRVNHPASHGGWRFYLQSYDDRARRYIIVGARRDPGRLAFLTGVWMSIVGTAWACWWPLRPEARA